MQTLTVSKSQIKRNLQPALAEVRALAKKAIHPNYRANDLEGARAALTEAESIIRAQEERISQLENMALTDDLTGLLNRRGFTLALQRELSFARRDKEASGILIMVDLDGFKSINDLCGHSAGDDYLQAVAHALLSEVRDNDIVARIGGDEFAILLTRMDEDLGISRLSKLEKSFNSRMMQWRDKTLPMRASFGLSSFDGNDTPESVMMSADLKLYAHKAYRRCTHAVRV
ncbi:MAG: GGDEF domain-containing protein [Alphaproteobacteria bacterium]